MEKPVEVFPKMDCKDCKNYKPKESEAVIKVMKDVRELLNAYCGNRNCDSCNLGTDRHPCASSQVFNILRKAEGQM